MLSDCLEGKKGELLLVNRGPTEASARVHRDRRLQAILPMSGEIFQVIGAPLEVALDNEEFRSLIATFGGVHLPEVGRLGTILSQFMGSLRYGRAFWRLTSNMRTPK